MLDSFTPETFEPLVDDAFSVEGGAGAVELRLIRVTRLGDSGRPGGRQPFSLLFVGPAEPLLEQRTWKIGHAGLGEFDLFMVPIGPEGAGLGYEAIFA